MRRSIGRSAAAVLCAAAILGMSGCSDVFETTVYNEDNKEISFSWWGGDDRNERTLMGLAVFKEQYGITVRPEYSEFEGFKKKMDSQLISGNEADVMQLNYDWLYQYSPDGEGFYDLSLLSAVVDLSTYPEGSLECGTINGKLIAVPYSFNAQTFIYNRTMYERYGLELPRTWDDLFDAAKVMVPDGVHPMAMTEKNIWLCSCAYFEQTTGRKLFDGTDRLDLSADDYEILIGFACDLLDKGVTRLGSQYDRQDLARGQVAGVLTWASDPGYFEKAAWENSFSIEIGDYLTTADPKLYGWYVKPTGVYAVSKDTKEPQAAGKLLNYLINSSDMAAMLEMSKGVPVSRSAMETLEARDLLDGIEHKATQKINDTPQLGVMSPYIENDGFITAFTDLYTEVYYGRSTVEEAAAQAAETMNSIRIVW
ncbi:MAG: carbohydrate ABC transporter substrate-binding protein [Ruminococcus sp.]|nr:carbohydrate ABC transporter substrate-binding protein [Ruminococcus sp.]